MASIRPQAGHPPGRASPRRPEYTGAQPVGIVIVEADPGQRRALTGIVGAAAGGRFAATSCATPQEAEAAIRARPDAIVIADLDTIGGPDRLATISGHRAAIATSANGSLTTAIAAMRAGAADFLPKPIGARMLLERLDAALAGWRPDSVPALQLAGDQDTDFAGFVGRSPAMLAVYDQIRRIAPSRAPVFITGESGTGKEVCAEAIHAHSGRADKPFVAINCSAIPRDLMESEIFGHVRGAFTGAAEDRVGAAELADGGTLFLDEIAEMDLGLQAKLLRFLQSGVYRRVGGTEARQVDVRVVSATNRDPAAEIAAARLRADLFYRLHVLPIHLVPLRERCDDILPLATFFLRRFAAEEGRRFTGFDAGAGAALTAFRWPGNVRQLANVIRRLVVIEEGPIVTASMLSDSLGKPRPGVLQTADRPSEAPVPPFWQQERGIIETALAAFGGSVARAAAALEISPSTIYRKQQSWRERSADGA
jgi:two-component system repressor protein LuxO